MRDPGRLYNLTDGEVVHLPSPNPLPPLPAIHWSSSPADYSFHRHISSDSDESTVFILHIPGPLQYRGGLVDHSFSKQFLGCDSVEFIVAILKEQARISGSRELRDHGKLVNPVKRLVDVLCSPLFTIVLHKGIDLSVRPKSIRWCTLLLPVVVTQRPFLPRKQYFLASASH
jgi:hypothetical protein